MRLKTTLGLVAIAGCHAAPSPPSLAPSRCDPGVPGRAQHPMAIKPADLAGDYELIEVETQPSAGSTSSGRLHLAPLDSTTRAGAVGGAVRNLIGWLEPTTGIRMSRTNAAARDSARPQVVLAGEHLTIGDVGSVNGNVDHLTITAVATDGFWGWWRATRGWEVTVEPKTRRVMPDPAGYFCALRVRP
jgi:hypothetical protein